MSGNGFVINYTGHEKNARALLLQQRIKTEKELATMTSREIEQSINAEFEVIQVGEDWLLITKEKYSDFVAISEWINR